MFFCSFFFLYININTFLNRQRSANKLTKDNWGYLTKQAHVKTYTKGDVILPEGTVLSKVYWLSRGYADLIKQVGESSVHIGILQKKQFIGDVCYLSSKSSTSVRFINIIVWKTQI